MDNIHSIFTNIQLDIINLTEEQQIDLLNKSLLSIDQLQKENKELQKIVKYFIYDKPCYFDKDTMDLMNYILQEININKTNPIIQSITTNNLIQPKKQYGGTEPEQQLNLIDRTSNRAMLPITQNNPILVISQLYNSGVPQEHIQSMIEILNKQTEANKILAEAELEQSKANKIYALIKEKTSAFERVTSRGLQVFSFLAPAPIAHHLNSSMNEILKYLVNNALNIGDISGSIELSIRNVVPSLLETAKTSVVYLGITQYLPSILKDTGKKLLQNEYTGIKATESIVTSNIANTLLSAEKISEEGNLIICFLLYIIMACLLLLSTNIINKLSKTSQIGIPLVFNMKFGNGGNKKHKKSYNKLKNKQQNKLKKNTKKNTKK